MRISENYNRAKQIYGKNIAQQAVAEGISNQYIYAACKFHIRFNIPFQNLKYWFTQWNKYVKDKANVNILDYNDFKKIIEKYKQKELAFGEIYNDGVVSVKRITSYEEMKKLPFANFWCIRKLKKWNEYKEEPSAYFLLVTNKHFSEESNCMYVMIEMYSDGNIGYWSTDNELIDERGSTGRLPKLSDYKKTLGGALTVIKQEQHKLMSLTEINTKSQYKMKQKIRLTEGDLHRIIRNCIHEALEYAYDEYLSNNSNADSIDLDDTDIAAISRKFVPNEPIDNYRRSARFYKNSDLQSNGIVDEGIGKYLKPMMVGGIMALGGMNAYAQDTANQKFMSQLGQNNTYYEITNQSKLPVKNMNEAKKLMQKIRTTTDALGGIQRDVLDQIDWNQNEEAKRRKEALVQSCIHDDNKNPIDANSFTLDELGYVNRFYYGVKGNGGQNIIVIKIESKRYFIPVHTLYTFWQIMFNTSLPKWILKYAYHE